MEEAFLLMAEEMQFSERLENHLESESFGKSAAAKAGTLRQIILGGQDGLVNVLGILLGVAEATGEPNTVIVAGLAATFAESISMGAVAYTSTQAERDYYFRHLEKERREIEEIPEIEKEEVKLIYMKMGFKGATLRKVVKDTVANKSLWLSFMMKEELGFSDDYARKNPSKEALVVTASAFAGSLVPLVPFFFLSIPVAIPVSMAVSVLTLFFAGAVKGKLTTGNPILRGLELAAIGIVSALAGYAVGAVFKVAI